MFHLSVTWEGLEKGDQVLRTKDHESDLVTEKDTGQPCGLSLSGEGAFLRTYLTCEHTDWWNDGQAARVRNLELEWGEYEYFLLSQFIIKTWNFVPIFHFLEVDSALTYFLKFIFTF